VDAILAIAAPTNKRQLRGFIGMINFTAMHSARVHLIAAMTSARRQKRYLQVVNELQRTFDEIKQQVAKRTMLHSLIPTAMEFTRSSK
jgi:hypothetical protein